MKPRRFSSAIISAGLSGIFAGCCWSFAGHADRITALLTGIGSGVALCFFAGHLLIALERRSAGDA